MIIRIYYFHNFLIIYSILGGDCSAYELDHQHLLQQQRDLSQRIDLQL